MRKQNLTKAFMAFMALSVAAATPVQAAKKNKKAKISVNQSKKTAKNTGVKKATVKKTTVKVKKITVGVPYSKTAVVAKGRKIKLSPIVTVTPNKAKNKGVVYESTDNKVASVNQKGVIQGINTGKAKITITSKNSNKKAVVNVKVVKNAVSKVRLNKKSAKTDVGDKLALKATVTAKKGAGKNLVWTSSDKAVATVSQKGVVTSKKAGNAIITAKSTDGSDKQATCKITVADNRDTKSADKCEIQSVEIVNPQTVAFTLSKETVLTADQVQVSKKKLAEGQYVSRLKIESLTTTDKIHYTMVLSTDSLLEERDYVRISIPSLGGTVSTLDKQYLEKASSYSSELIFVGETGKELVKTHGVSLEGYTKYTVQGLPAGITAIERNDGLKFKGVPKETGVTTATVTYQDEAGNVGLDKIVFVIGSQDTVAAGALEKYYILGGGAEDSYEAQIASIGGTQSYEYKVLDAGDLSVTISKFGEVSVKNITKAGDYSITVQVTDTNGRAAKAVVVLHVQQAYDVKGKVTDTQGNPVPNAIIKFKNKDKGNRYLPEAYTGTDSKGEYSLRMIPGTYDIYAGYKNVEFSAVEDYDEDNEVEKYVYNVIIGKDGVAPTVALPVSKVSIGGIAENDEVTWYNQNGERVGKGQTLFLKPGTYILASNEIKNNITDDWKGMTYDKYKYEVSLTVGTEAVSTNAVKTVLEAKKFVSNVSEKEIKEGKNSIGSNSEQYFKFTPADAGEYAVRDNRGVVLSLFDENNKAVAQTEGHTYQLTAGQTYYILFGASEADSEIQIDQATKETGK